jgi:hypothetical protein
LKCFAGEIAQLQSEISHSERLREAMAVEMTKLTEKAEQVRSKNVTCKYTMYRQQVTSLSLLHAQWLVVFRPKKTSAGIYRPSFRENKPKMLVFND